MQHICKQIGKDKSLLYAWFDAMHTRVDIMMYAKTEDELKEAARLILDKIEELEKVGNSFDPASELSYLNRMAYNHPIAVSESLYTMIKMALDYQKLTSGYFDITVHSDGHNQETASQVVLNDQNRLIQFKQEGLQINLSGFIKGYALDLIRPIVQEAGITDALINIGNSSVLAVGNHPHGKGWKIKVENQPDNAPDLHLANQCLTTSGNNFPDRKHIIDPHSGNYIEGEKYISVVTDQGAEGEVLSTALFAAPREEWETIMKNFKAIIFDF